MNWQILQGDALTVLASLDGESVHTCVTSPPYWGLRDYGIEGQIGLEKTPEEYVARLVEIFREVKRVLRADGTLWLNLGDSYAANRSYQVPDSKHVDVGNSNGMKASDFGMKPKDLVGIPWMVAFALRADGWYLRSDIIWSKPNAMPESVTDRPTKSHEYIFLLSKSERYYYNADAIREPHVEFRKRTFPGFVKGVDERKAEGSGGCAGGHPSGRNRRTVWTVTTKPYNEAHFATFPHKLIEPCVLAGAPVGRTVFDPFCGSGTTGAVAIKHQRKFIGIELNPAYIDMAQRRIAEAERQEVLNFEAVA